MAGEKYDEEFNNFLATSKKLVSQLKSKRDKQIASKWVQKLCSLQSDDLTVKKNRNAFFQYMLKVLREGIKEGNLPPGKSGKKTDKSDTEEEPVEVNKNVPSYITHWSADRTVYMAAKPIPGRGALVYLAVSHDPKLGWEEPAKRMKKIKASASATSCRTF